MKRVTMLVLPVVALTCFSSFVEALWVGMENPEAAKTSKSTGAGVQPEAHDTGVQVGVDGGTQQEQNKPKDTRKVTFVQPQSNADEHVDVSVLKSELRKINVNPSTVTLDSLKRAVGIIEELGWLPLWLKQTSRRFIAPYKSQPRFLPHDTTDQIRLGNVVSDQYKHDLDAEMKMIKGQVDLLVNLVLDNFDKLFAGNFHEKKHFESRRLSVQNSIGYMMKRYPGEKRVMDLNMEFDQNWPLSSEKVNHLMSSDDREDPVFFEFQNFVGRVKEALVSLCKKESR